jgi:hypothetical protein
MLLSHASCNAIMSSHGHSQSVCKQEKTSVTFDIRNECRGRLTDYVEGRTMFDLSQYFSRAFEQTNQGLKKSLEGDGLHAGAENGTATAGLSTSR